MAEPRCGVVLVPLQTYDILKAFRSDQLAESRFFGTLSQNMHAQSVQSVLMDQQGCRANQHVEPLLMMESPGRDDSKEVTVLRAPRAFLR